MSIRNYPSSLVWAFFKRHFLDDSQFGTMYKTTQSSQSYIEFNELKNEIIFHDFDKFFCYSWLQHRYLSKRESRRSKIRDILESTKTIICFRWERYFTMVIVDSLLRHFCWSRDKINSHLSQTIGVKLWLKLNGPIWKIRQSKNSEIDVLKLSKRRQSFTHPKNVLNDRPIIF